MASTFICEYKSFRSNISWIYFFTLQSSTSAAQTTETMTSSSEGNIVSSTSLVDQAQTATTTSVQATSTYANGKNE